MTIRDDARIVREALAALPATCRYHGSDFYGGEMFNRYDGACCESGVPAVLRDRATEAVQRLAFNA